MTVSSEIRGRIFYAGTRPGTLRIALFADAGLTQQLYETVIATPAYPQDYSFASPPPDAQGIVPGTYFVRAFIDVNGNGARDSGEPVGAFGGGVTVAEANSQTADLTVLDAAIGR